MRTWWSCLPIVLVLACNSRAPQSDVCDEPEVCDGIDNDCDGRIDDDDPDVVLAGRETYFPDRDQDGYGDPEQGLMACTLPAGYVADNGDCDDTDPLVSPSAPEVCNAKDDDCDGLLNDDDDSLDVSTTNTWWPDGDGDGFGDALGSPFVTCDPRPSNYAVANDDCDDSDPFIFPGQMEACNGVDDDCDPFTGDAGVWWQEAANGLLSNRTADFEAGTAASPYDFGAPADGTLFVCEGTWFARVDGRSHELVVLGPAGYDVTILDGGFDVNADGSVPVIQNRDATSLSVEGLTVQNARDGVVGVNTDMVLSEVVVLDTGDGTLGVAVSAFNADLTVNGALLDGHAGFAALLLVNATFNVTDLTSSNNASVNGAGATLDGSSGTFRRATFSDNLASGEGGGMKVQDCDVDIVNSVFQGNVAAFGGAAWVSGGTLTVQGTDISANQATSSGGGIFADDVSIDLTETEVDSNTAFEGAGLWLGGDLDATLTDSLVLDNVATGRGGGAFVEGDKVASCIKTALGRHGFVSNVAGDGGAVFLLAAATYSSGAPIERLNALDSSNCDYGSTLGGDDNLPNDVVYEETISCLDGVCEDSFLRLTPVYDDNVTDCVGAQC